MKKIFIQACVTISAIVFLSGTLFSAENRSVQVRKQPEIQQIKPKKPVKIKLKRSAEASYTWELSGDNIDEIVKADKRLRKLLEIQ